MFREGQRAKIREIVEEAFAIIKRRQLEMYYKAIESAAANRGARHQNQAVPHITSTQSQTQTSTRSEGPQHREALEATQNPQSPTLGEQMGSAGDAPREDPPLTEEELDLPSDFTLDPHAILERAIANCAPSLQLQKVVRAGFIYKVFTDYRYHLYSSLYSSIPPSDPPSPVT